MNGLLIFRTNESILLGGGQKRGEAGVAEGVSAVEKPGRIVIFVIRGTVRAGEIDLHSYFFRLVNYNNSR